MSSGALGNMAKTLTIPELAIELLSRFAVRFLSGNRAEVLSGNEASDNQLKALSDIQADFLSNNHVSLFSELDVQLLSNVQLHITINNSGNTHQGAPGERQEPGRELQRERGQGGPLRDRERESPEERIRQELQRRRQELENELSQIRRELELHRHVGPDENPVAVDNPPAARQHRDRY
jgi:hypothetical protein